MRSPQVLLTLLLALLVGLAAPAVHAQDAQNSPDVISVHYDVKVKPGMADAFESATQRHLQWRADHDDPWTWEVYHVAVGPRMGEYAFRSNNHHWDHIDAYDAWSGPARDHFYATVMPYVESITSTIDVMNLDVWRLPDDMSGHNLWTVEYHHLKPGKGMVFEETVKKIHGAIVEHDYPYHYALMYSAVGGPGHVAVFVSPHKNWASMQGPEQEFGAFMAEAFGPEEAGQLFEAFMSTIDRTESMVVRLRTDLMPATTMASGSQ